MLFPNIPRPFPLLICIFSGIIPLCLAQTDSSANPTSHSRVSAVNPASTDRMLQNRGKLPLSFEANQGQSDSHVKFISRGGGYTLFLTPTEAVLQLRSRTRAHSAEARPAPESGAVLRMKFSGANPNPQVSGIDTLSAKSNYFIGNDPAKWRTAVPSYSRVEYRSVYPGVDLVYYGNQRELEYDWVIAPGADPKKIRMKVEGATRLHVDALGDLILRTSLGEIRQHRPNVYQEVAGVKQNVSGKYVLTGDKEVRFAVAAYDSRLPLIIDPVLSYSTYLGGGGADVGNAIAVDSLGNTYVAGVTNSTTFPVTAGATQTNFPGGFNDAFVTKLNPAGTAIIYSTYLGGNSGFYGDGARGVSVDAGGNAYVTGYANSSNFPITTGAFQKTFAGGGFTGCCLPGDIFVAKLNPTGSALLYSTYLGGSGWDIGESIVVDAAGNAYVTGQTDSTNFPVTPGAFQTAFRGSYGCGGNRNSAFVTKLNPAGTGLVYSTYLGGGGFDNAYSIAIDGAGAAYVTGWAGSNDFPVTPGAFQTSVPSPCGRPFVTKVNPLGNGLAYSTYLGGSSGSGRSIAVDTAGDAYVAGTTSASNFPVTPEAFQPALAGSSNAFVTKLNPAGSGLVYSTYLGAGTSEGTGLAIDSAGNAWVVGDSDAATFPVTPDAPQLVFAGTRDAFVTKFNSTGSGILFSTYLGGSGSDTAFAITVNNGGNAFVTGLTTSLNFPTTGGAVQVAYGGGGADAFVAKFTPPPAPSGSTPQTITFDPLPDVLVGSLFSLAASSTSGLTVTFTSTTPAVCAVAGNTAAVSATGVCSITATQEGTAIFAAATPVAQAFVARTAGSGGPIIKPDGIGRVFSSSTTIQPGSWISIYGSNLATTTAIWKGDFPTSLGGVRVTVNGNTGYLSYVSPGQINLQAPDDSTRGRVHVTVTTLSGSWTSVVTLGSFGPAFSLLDSKHLAGVILRSDGSGAHGGGSYDIIGPAGTSLGYKTVAAKPGDVVELFGVGFGTTNPDVPAGQAFSGGATARNTVNLLINNISVTSSFVGLSSGGLFQINLTIPAGLGAGDLPILASVGGVQTQSGVVISMQNAAVASPQEPGSN